MMRIARDVLVRKLTFSEQLIEKNNPERNQSVYYQNILLTIEQLKSSGDLSHRNDDDEYKPSRKLQLNFEGSNTMIVFDKVWRDDIKFNTMECSVYNAYVTYGPLYFFLSLDCENLV